MYKKKGELVLVKMKLLEGITNPRIWAGYLLGIGYAWFVSGRYMAFSSGRPVQAAESFLVLLDRRLFLSVLMMGYFLIVADAPFISQRTYLTMGRCGKRRWLRSMLLYLLIQTMLYYSVVLMACVLSGIAESYLQNVWSEPMDILCRIRPDDALLKYNLTYPSFEILNSLLPWEAAGHALVLILGYSYFLSSIAVLGNLYFSGIVGSVLMVLVYMAGIIMVNDMIFYPIWISLLGNAILSMHFYNDVPVPLSYSYFLLYGLVLVLNRLIMSNSYRIDFVQGQGEIR